MEAPGQPHPEWDQEKLPGAATFALTASSASASNTTRTRVASRTGPAWHAGVMNEPPRPASSATPIAESSAPAVRRFLSLRDERDPTLRAFFAANAPVFLASAPGRLDVMGGIADYSGSLVLQLPLDRQTVAMLQPHREPTIRILSLRNGQPYHLGADLDALLTGSLSTPERLATFFVDNHVDRWGAYVLGVVHACLVQYADRVHVAPHGWRMLIDSRVPEGKGIASSAALEVACLAAIAACYASDLTAEQIAGACQWAENNIAGAPCGIMDQMTSACGRENHLLRLRCQPATIEGQILVPAGYRFYGIDSGIRHAVTGAGYGTVRAAAFMGYRMIAEMSDRTVEHDGARVRIADDPYRGYLANIPPADFAGRFESGLPERMLGSEFLSRFHGLTDVATRVQYDRWYPVRQATSHPVHENDRVERFAELLGRLNDFSDVAASMGDLMRESHASYSACGLGSDGTDRLVELVKEAGEGSGLFGAKITGGGSGGTVAVLGTQDAEPTVRAIARRYESETGRHAEVFAESGHGMAEQGVFTLLGTG